MQTDVIFIRNRDVTSILRPLFSIIIIFYYVVITIKKKSGVKPGNCDRQREPY